MSWEYRTEPFYQANDVKCVNFEYHLGSGSYAICKLSGRVVNNGADSPRCPCTKYVLPIDK